MRRLIVVLMLALLLVACKPGEKKVSIESPFLSGTQGLAAGFQDLRADVFDGGRDPFDVIVKLENKGESLVRKENVRVRLSGINPFEFAKTEQNLILNAPDDAIETRKDPQANVLPGPPVFVEFIGLNHNAPISGATAQFPLRADICYLYHTKAVSKLCVRENLLTPRASGICELNENKPVYNSGAPVQFVNVKESTRAKDKIGFTFEVTNAGDGVVYERNSFCDRTARKNENRVYIIVNTGIPGLLCTGLETTSNGAEGFVTLYGGNKIVSCSQPISSRSDFEQIMDIEAVYDYEQTIQTTLTVKSSGEGVSS